MSVVRGSGHNALINPYGIFSTKLIPIENKPAALTHMRMHKAHQVNRISPKTIILGTSRAAIGLDPNNSHFNHQPVYNLALDGANVYEILCYLKHANRANQLKEVVLSLDLMSFNTHMSNKPDFEEQRLSYTQPISYETQILQSLFSLESTTDSYKTLFHKFDKASPTLNSKGATQEAALIYYKISSGGHHNTSRHSENTYIRDVYRPFAIKDAANKLTHFEHFESILRFCHFHHIKLILLFSPSHVRHHVLIDSIGYWDEYEKWKRNIVNYNLKVAKEFNAQPFMLWDFSGFNSYTTEPVPEMGDAQYSMKWFWETSHFNKNLGDVILNRIHSIDISNQDAQKQSFGYLLTANNIDFHLQKIRKEKDTFKANNQEIVSEIAALSAEV